MKHTIVRRALCADGFAVSRDPSGRGPPPGKSERGALVSCGSVGSVHRERG